MDPFLSTLQAVAVLLGIGVLGFWLVGRRREPDSTLAFLTTLAIDIALPLLVLANLIRDFSPREYPDWWQLLLWWCGFTFTSLALSLILSFIVRREIRSEFRIGLFFQNGLFFPLIIIGGLFGQGNPYMVPLLVFLAPYPSLVFSVYPLFFRRSGIKLNWRRILNPVLVATLIGILIGMVGINRYIPSSVLSLLTMVGAMATPLFMLILGGNIYKDLVFHGKEQREFCPADIIKFVCIKNLLFPLVFLGLLIILKPDAVIAFIIILQAAVPPITAIPILVERCGGKRTFASQFVVASFIISVISIPLAIYLFNLVFSIPSITT